MPNTFEYVDPDTYIGSDLKKGNVWCEDKGFLSCWFHIDCIIIVWKSKVRLRTIDPKMRIPAKQISIIKASLEVYKSHSGNE
jgi:hypothetical protein